MATRPNDFFFDQQWYLVNRGQGNRTQGIDLNVLKVWNDYTGKGVSISVLDSATERDHEDLQANYDANPSGLPGYSYQRDGAPDRDDDGHGTSVAGIIAAARNDIGTTGIAYNAKITGFRTGNITENDVSPIEQQQAFDISNNSWGVDNPFQSSFKLAPYTQEGEALEAGVRNGRNGLGTIFVWGAGNEFEAGMSSNYGGYESSRFTIPVAAMDGNGIVAPYSVQGSNLLVTAFGDGDPDRGIDGTIVTTDRTGRDGYNPFPGASKELNNRNYTALFNGTSAAAPMVSGVVALMLEANPQLGYRDVQEILAYSARQTDRNDVDAEGKKNWVYNDAYNWNGGGLHTNLNYGYGLVDAHAAVRLAETWRTQHTLANEQQLSTASTTAMTIADTTTSTATLNVASGLAIDQVEVDINLSHQSIEDLVITLISPSGTQSRLFNGPDLTEILLEDSSRVPFAEFADDPSAFTSDEELIALGNSYRQGINFTFSTTFHWGETGIGDWSLDIQDVKAGTTGTLNNWSLSLYGDAVSEDNTYFYSNDFAQAVRQDASTNRAVLSDASGIDRINASMVTRNLSLNLTGGSRSKIAGQTLTIDADTVIEEAFGGDGKDRIRGNTVNNLLDGGRNNDILIGKGGIDMLLGGAGSDRLKGGAETDRLMGQDGNDRLIGGSGNDRLLGGRNNDRLNGGQGSDVLKGGTGDDWLDGKGGGNDRLKGNQGNDIFVLNQGDGQSTIQDFRDGSDRLGLSRGISFQSLEIVQDGNAVVISVGTDILASLTGVRLTQLSQDDFLRA